MKYIDKFLKFLKTDRNTFLTFILTLFSIYVLVDRLVELVFLFFSGISVSYWNPIQYTLALACPIFAFLFSGASKYADSRKTKVTLFYTYYIALYIVGVSMFVQWINYILWLLLLSVPNYVELVVDFSDLIKPAFQAIAIYLPLVTFYPIVFKFLFLKVNDTELMIKSINDYKGIDLADKTGGWGPYTCEMPICKDTVTGKTIKIPEIRRFESMLVIGPAGAGKTTMILEPMIAKDIEKKFFYRQISREMGYTALKTGIARLNEPYTNEYLNKNFSLSMLSPADGKEQLYKTYMKKIIHVENGEHGILYKDLGITAMFPDYEAVSHIIDIAKNYKTNINIIDPANRNSLGLNPFVYENPVQTSVAISSALMAMYDSPTDNELAYREHAATQAIENIAIILKEMYPRLHDKDLPTIEDILNCLNNFNLVEDLCNKLEENEELAKKYKIQLNYFKKYFFTNAPGRADMEKFTAIAASQLDALLRNDGVRNILCKREMTDNINYDKALANGEVTFVCTRRGDLGAKATKAFGLFFLMLMQHSVLRRPGNEKTRIPHFLYIDEFSDYIGYSTEAIFTLYRKYRVGTVVSAQDISQLSRNGKVKYRETILANCTTKVVFGNNTPEDNEWWSKELGEKQAWKFTNSYKTDKGEYDSTLGGISWGPKPNIYPGQVQSLGAKTIAMKTKDVGGKNIFSKGKVDFLESKYKEEHKFKIYNFNKFTSGIIEEDNEVKKSGRRNRFNPKEITFQTAYNGEESDPIQFNTSDSNYLFDNENAVIFDINNKKTKKKKENEEE